MFIDSIPGNTAYFSAADGQAEAFLDERAWQPQFETALLHNLLFQPLTLVPDVFFYINRGLAAHVGQSRKRREDSLLSQAIARGLLVPAFRDRERATFADAYSVIADQGIVGLLPRHACEEIAADLDGLRHSSDRRWTAWPETEQVSEHYAALLYGTLMPDGDEVPDTLADRDLWHETAYLRHESLRRAGGRSTAGLRRGDVLTALAEIVGLPAQTLDRATLAASRLDARERQRVQAVTTWVNDLYHLNQADRFAIRRTLPVYRDGLSILPPTGRMDGPFEEEHVVTVSASLVPLPVLLRVDPAKLLDVRLSLAGEAYINALQSSSDEGDDAIRGRIEDRFIRYAEQLNRLASGHPSFSESRLTVRVTRHNGAVRKVLGTASAAAYAGAGMIDPRLAGALLVSRGLSALHTWRRDRPVPTSQRVDTGIGVTLPPVHGPAA